MLGTFLENKRSKLNQQMEQQIYSMQIPEKLRESILYSIEAGGKRIRPVLLLAANEAFGGMEDRALAPACAVEMIHTYSLIHDDLPAMDDDDVRRGKPTNHMQFDEATAILAGDGLLTAAFHVITANDHLTDREKVFLTRELSKASGAEGMVAGQMLDMEAEEKTLSLEELEAIHRHKTGELLRFSAVAGAFIGGANPTQLRQIETYANYIGLLFQVQDDILDVIGEEGEIGKPVGSDVTNHKSTYPQLLGLEGAIEHKQKYAERARAALKEAGVDSSLLEDLIDYISDRKN
ncbi:MULTISPECIES: polyprenyl synthetase family protein [Pontibacillus]|uniref:Polyprenyl synthetase family protein n=1 Tax=Pontibacillus chungwhensis TaxID=265426 RepID=A0ABY8V2N0_9BACI|nr:MULTISPECIES: farnesyl diphosphate synthase [Pontibacillus]MCD5323511.1 polyprenyl synthetase family protein [Pontibacillus sp. HN14]WIG00216.1 polyprenyl synthetase family protein [Pontibacillus chungwhensis]